MVYFFTKLCWPTLLSVIMPFACILGVGADNEGFQFSKMRNVTIMLPFIGAVPNEQCPDGSQWDYVGGFNVIMRLVDFKKFFGNDDCLSAYICYESERIAIEKMKPQYHFDNLQGMNIGKICENANLEHAKFHGFSVSLCLNGNYIKGTLEQSITNHAWDFKVPNANIEKDVNLSLHFGVNSMELNSWRENKVENIIRQERMKGGFYNFNEDQLNKDNSLWYTFMDATFLTPYGMYLFSDNPFRRSGDYYRHFRVSYPNVCEVSKENSKTNMEAWSLVIECNANRKDIPQNEINQCGRRHRKSEEVDSYFPN